MNLVDYFLSNSERNMIHKPMSYFEIYERHFSKFKRRSVKILEIGVSHGGSLDMWKMYLGNKAEVVGIDIDPRCKKFESPGTRIYIGSQDDELFLRSVIATEDYFDIIIDDGGHFMVQQIMSFNVLYETLKDGGVYLCEDTGTSYNNAYGGGLGKQGTFIEMMKKRIDDLYAYETPQVEKSYFARNTYGIYFYENIVAIDKRMHVMSDTRAIGVPSL